MALAVGLQQLTSIGVYVVPGKVFADALAGAQQFADELLLAMIWRSNPQRIQDNTGKNGDAGGDNRVQQGDFPTKGHPH